MTPSDRRQLLELKGFAVAGRPFAGEESVPHYYVLELLLDGTRGAQTQNAKVENNLLGRQYSIDLETGIWNKWGTAERYAFDAGPWNEQAIECDHEPISEVCETDQSKAETEIHGLSDFFESCVEIGFELDERGPNQITEDVTNWFARFEGEKYLLADQPNVKAIVDKRFNSFSLAEFIKLNQTPEEQTQEPVFSLKENPVIHSGATKQVSLF